ncbi:MAG: hypothetical protein OXU45_04320, partial [Candidatus Melainabacteria bacterium]|nr:hypothetical protein [Candidatus Melainabacteria bacterium]
SKLEKYPVFGHWVLGQLGVNPRSLKNSISRWVKQGLVIRLRQGLYTLRQKDQKAQSSSYYLANQIYPPSYVSLEYALQFYDMVPEGVFEITSVTSKKTISFSNQLGKFSYTHIKQEAFTGYLSLKDQYNNNFLIASREKALLDFLYLRTRHLKKIDINIFEKSYRLQNLDDIDCVKLKSMSTVFKSKKLDSLTKMLINYIQEEWQ